MDQRIVQGADDRPLSFLLVRSSDHITPATGLGSSVSVVLSKNGQPFGTTAGAVSELGQGWYQVAAEAGDVDTLGPLILHVSATGADPCDVLYFVVPSYSAGAYYQNTPGNVLPWLMVLSSDHATGAIGVAPTLLLNSPGNAFAPPAGAIIEVGNGWYALMPAAADLATPGPLLLHATGTGADPADELFDVLPQSVAGGGGGTAPTSVLAALIASIKGLIIGTGLFTAKSVFVTLDLNDPQNPARQSRQFCALLPAPQSLIQSQYDGAGTYLTGMSGELVVRVAARTHTDQGGKDDAALLTASVGLVDLACAVAAALDGQFPLDPQGNALTQIETRVGRIDGPVPIPCEEKLRGWRAIDLHVNVQWTLKVQPK